MFRADIEQSKRWRIRTHKYDIGPAIIDPISAAKFTEFDPGVPFIYLPRSDFDELSKLINNGFREKLNNGTNICGEKSCFISSSCSEIHKTNFYGQNLSFTMALDPSNSLSEIDRNKQDPLRFQNVYYNLTVPNQHLWIPGSEVGDTDDRCYFPYFPYDNSQDTWLVGRIIFQVYYFIFDQSRASEEQESKSDSERVLKIGISYP